MPTIDGTKVNETPEERLIRLNLVEAPKTKAETKAEIKAEKQAEKEEGKDEKEEAKQDTKS